MSSVVQVPFLLSHYGFSDQGVVRKNNEDFWGVSSHGNTYALADGIGGRNAGEVAAEMSIDLTLRSLEMSQLAGGNVIDADEALAIMREAFTYANENVVALSQRDIACKGMGTTLCCMHFCDDGMTAYAHVGDSRIYRLRDKKIKQLTEDHVPQRPLHGKRRSHVITKAIGVSSFVDPSVAVTTTHLDDIYVLCSDGLTDGLYDEDIADIIMNNDDSERAALHLIEEAKNGGSGDNITVVIIKAENVL